MKVEVFNADGEKIAKLENVKSVRTTYDSDVHEVRIRLADGSDTNSNSWVTFDLTKYSINIPRVETFEIQPTEEF